MPSCPYMNPKPTFTHLAYPFINVFSSMASRALLISSVNKISYHGRSLANDICITGYAFTHIS